MVGRARVQRRSGRAGVAPDGAALALRAASASWTSMRIAIRAIRIGAMPQAGPRSLTNGLRRTARAMVWKIVAPSCPLPPGRARAAISPLSRVTSTVPTVSPFSTGARKPFLGTRTALGGFGPLGRTTERGAPATASIRASDLPHRDAARDRVARGVERARRKLGEPGAEQVCGLLETRLVRLGAENDRDQAHALPLGGRAEAEPGLAGVAGLQAIEPRETAEELVGVLEQELPITERRLLDARPLEDVRHRDEMLCDLRDVARARDISLARLVVEAVDVDVARCRQAQSPGRGCSSDRRTPSDGPGNVLGDRDAGVVRRVDHDRLHQVLESERPPPRSGRPASRRSCSPRPRPDRLVERSSPPGPLEDEELEHRLGDAGRRAGKVGVLLVEDLPGGRLDQDGGDGPNGAGLDPQGQAWARGEDENKAQNDRRDEP